MKFAHHAAPWEEEPDGLGSPGPRRQFSALSPYSASRTIQVLPATPSGLLFGKSGLRTR